MAASFIVTVFIFIFLVRRAKPENKFYWIIACSIATLAWLGLYKGIVAVIISVAFTSGYISDRIDARRLGKKVAKSLGIGPNLFFSCLEQTMPLYLKILAIMEQEGTGVAEARKILIPMISNGLDILESRFGPQPQIEDAREKIRASGELEIS